MTVPMIDSPVAPSASTLHRVHRRAIAVIAFGVAFSLIVLLPLLPGTDAASIRWMTGAMVLFVGGAVAAVAAIGAVLVSATRGSGD